MILCRSDYQKSANSAYANLESYEDIFAMEAKAIYRAKCMLAQEVELENFYVDGMAVEVYRLGRGYELHFGGYCLFIEVDDKEIVDFSLSK